MDKHRLIAFAIAAFHSGAALAAPQVADSAIPLQSPALTLGCALFLLTTMQRRR